MDKIITTPAQENYIETIYHLSLRGPVRPSELADTLGVKRASVSKYIVTLVGKGLVKHLPRGDIYLTDQGIGLAKSILKRDKCLTRLLVDVCNMPPEDAESEVHRLEHLVSDDDQNVRLLTRQCLEAEGMIVVEAADGLETLDVFVRERPDLVFLDVEMPIISGFDLLESLENSPQIILITGKPDYALKAFDYDVTDYLHKPITMARFDASVKRAVAKYEQMHQVHEDEEHIFVKSNLKKRKVILNDIKWIEALGDYIKLVTDEANIVILSTMKSFEKQLPEEKFLRIHKSYIVNLEKIEKFNSKNVEVSGRSIPLSRNKKTELAEALSNV